MVGKQLFFEEAVLIKIEEVEVVLHRLLKAQRERTSGTACLGDELLAEYLTGRPSEEIRNAVEAHATVCASCTDTLVAAYKSAQTFVDQMPSQSLVDKAKALIHRGTAPENWLDLVVTLVLDSIRLVGTSGRVIQAVAPIGIRGKGKSPGTSILRVEKQVEKFTAVVEVERLGGDLCQVAVTVKLRNGAIQDNIRLSLMSGEREQASYLARQGSAIFDRIPPGDYRLRVSDSGGSMGSIRLTIKEGCDERKRQTH